MIPYLQKVFEDLGIVELEAVPQNYEIKEITFDLNSLLRNFPDFYNIMTESVSSYTDKDILYDALISEQIQIETSTYDWDKNGKQLFNAEIAIDNSFYNNTIGYNFYENNMENIDKMACAISRNVSAALNTEIKNNLDNIVEGYYPMDNLIYNIGLNVITEHLEDIQEQTLDFKEKANIGRKIAYYSNMKKDTNTNSLAHQLETAIKAYRSQKVFNQKEKPISYER